MGSRPKSDSKFQPFRVFEVIRQRLARITSSGRFVPEIDSLRFFAITGVVLFHLNGYVATKLYSNPTLPESSLLYQMLQGGSFGVQLFFAISGFIISLPFAEVHLLGARTVSLRKYFLRRLTRLEPPNFICLLLFYFLLVRFKGMSALQQLPHLLASLTYTHQAIYRVPSTIEFAAWSLEVEVAFYMMAPWLCQVFRIRQAWVRRALILAPVLLGFPVWGCHEEQGFPLLVLAQMPYFFVGFFLVDIYLMEWNSRPVPGLKWDLIGLVFWLLIFGLAFAVGDKRSPLMPAVTLFAYVSAFRGRTINRIMRNPWLMTLGGMCYSFYLYHSAVISAIGRLAIRIPSTGSYGLDLMIQGAVILPGLAAAGSLIFALSEKPFMRRDWPARVARGVRELRLARRNRTVPETADSAADKKSDSTGP
jgi:peptidoglycan/LPS O-acetylase OafA/YrhL